MDAYTKRMKTDVENRNYALRCQMPDLVKDAYGFDENSISENDSYSSSPVYLKK